MDTKTKGFTLIELLVVISIIALLSSVVLSSLTSARSKARDTRRLSDVTQIRAALSLYQVDHGGDLPNPTTLGCPATSGGWYCLGGGNTGTCWGSTSYKGCTALDSQITPYLATIPKDPENNTAYYGDVYTYNYSYNAMGQVLHWGMDEAPLTTNDCMGGLVGQWNSLGRNRYYCILSIGR